MLERGPLEQLHQEERAGGTGPRQEKPGARSKLSSCPAGQGGSSQGGDDAGPQRAASCGKVGGIMGGKDPPVSTRDWEQGWPQPEETQEDSSNLGEAERHMGRSLTRQFSGYGRKSLAKPGNVGGERQVCEGISGHRAC